MLPALRSKNEKAGGLSQSDMIAILMGDNAQINTIQEQTTIYRESNIRPQYVTVLERVTVA